MQERFDHPIQLEYITYYEASTISLSSDTMSRNQLNQKLKLIVEAQDILYTFNIY